MRENNNNKTGMLSTFFFRLPFLPTLNRRATTFYTIKAALRVSVKWRFRRLLLALMLRWHMAGGVKTLLALVASLRAAAGTWLAWLRALQPYLPSQCVARARARARSHNHQTARGDVAAA